MTGASDQLPPPALSGDPSVFSDYLRDIGQPFLLLDEPQDERVHVRFTGPFEGAQVVWDCEFVTLRAERRHHSPDSPGAAGGRRSFIDIGAAGDRGVALRVGLDLAHIDRPAILKMMVMIRNYKRLRRGRHEFGSVACP